MLIRIISDKWKLLEFIYVSANKIVNIRRQYLKPFNCVQKNDLRLVLKIIVNEQFVYKC